MSELRFFESADNLLRTLQTRAGPGVTPELARLATTYLAQGRLYFEAARRADLAIRPLIIYYGMVGFAGAITLCRSLDDDYVRQNRHHGLTHDMREERVAGFSAKVAREGTFHYLNNAIRTMYSARFHQNKNSTYEWCPTVDSSVLIGRRFSIKEALARIPGLENLYQLTFGEPPGVLQCGATTMRTVGLYEIDVFPTSVVKTTEQVRTVVRGLRERFPLLDRSVLTEAHDQGNSTSLRFVGYERQGYDEFCGEISHDRQTHWEFRGFKGKTLLQRHEFLLPIFADIEGEPLSLLQATDVGHVSDISFLYIAMFILSNIVRYRPYVWTHAISSTTTASRQSDDHMIAVLEKLMDVALDRMPQLALATIRR